MNDDIINMNSQETIKPEQDKQQLSTRLSELSKQLPTLAMMAITFLSSSNIPDTIGGIDHRG